MNAHEGGDAPGNGGKYSPILQRLAHAAEPGSHGCRCFAGSRVRTGKGETEGQAHAMGDLTKLPHQLDRKTGLVRAIIETPKGRRSKYDYDPDIRLFRLKTILPEGMSFPLDFGFIPSTLCEDGDPLDVMVLVDEPTEVGALVQVRLIGVIEAEEKEKGRAERNDRLIAVVDESRLYGALKTPDDLPDKFIENLTEFWINKDRLEGKDFRALGVQGPAAAIELVRHASKVAKKAA
jgi:inorganic pyrophosphatase